MAEPLVRVFAFDAYAARDAGAARAGVGVTIAPRQVKSMVGLRGSATDEGFVRDAAAAFELALPLEPNTAAGNDGVRALWLGPNEWLFAASRDLRIDKPIANSTLTDVSHGRAVVRLSGREVRAALAKGCALDLDSRVFPPNACAQTAIAKINIVLDHVEPDVFDVYCPRSYAGSFWHWITEAAAEYACNIELGSDPIFC